MVTAAPVASPPASHRPALSHRRRKLHIPFRVSMAPLLPAAMCFATGILLTRHFAFMPGLLSLTLLATFLLTTAANIYVKRLAWAAACLLFLVLGIFSATTAPGIDPQTRLIFLANGKPRLVEGEIVRLGPLRTVASSGPFSSKIRQEQSRQIDLKLLSPDGPAVPGALPLAVRVSLYAPLDYSYPNLFCGQRLSGILTMHTEERFLDPSVWDEQQYLLDQGIGALASVRVQDLKPGPEKSSASIRCRLQSAQLWASKKIEDVAARSDQSKINSLFKLSREDAAMLSAMLTGDRSHLRHRLRVGFERTGSFHLLVVSGLHLAIFSSVIFAVARRLRLSRLLTTAITIICSCAYAVFTGFGHPVQRALGMVTVYLIGRLLWRDRSAFNAIGLVAIVLLVADPGSITDSGMQMTLLSVIAIAGVASPAVEKTFGPYLHAVRHLRVVRIDPASSPRIAQFRVSLRMLAQNFRPLIGTFAAWRVLPFGIKVSLRIGELLIVSTTIELFMVLPMAVYFHRFTVLALPVNLLIVPFLGLLLPIAIVTFLTILLSPTLALAPAAITALLLHTVGVIVSFFSTMHSAEWRLPMPHASVLIAWMVLCIAAICLVRMRRFAVFSAAIVLATAAGIVIFPRPISFRPHALEVTAIDVGQGDSLLLVTPEGKTLLIDAGGLVGSTPDSNFDVGEDVVSPVLWSRGIQRLDAVAMTHAHADHIGGMPAVIENFRPREFWIGKNPDVPAYDHLLQIAKQTGANIMAHSAGDTFRFGSILIQVLAPAQNYQPGAAPSNNDSLVLRVTYGKTSALLEGDAESQSEARMLLSGGSIHSDLLKVGHHGSITSTTLPFLAAVAPTYAVISVGARNFYGHPRREVLRELQSASVRTYLTERTGLTSFYLDGEHVSAETWSESNR